MNRLQQTMNLRTVVVPQGNTKKVITVTYLYVRFPVSTEANTGCYSVQAVLLDEFCRTELTLGCLLRFAPLAILVGCFSTGAE